MLIKNIESKIKLARNLLIINSVVTFLIISSILFFAFTVINNEKKHIYVLTNQGVPIMAEMTDMNVNRGVEYKSAINDFHNLFFNLAPDDEFIRYNLEKAMYLVDESGGMQYDNLKESGYYNQILASSASLVVKPDSINLNESSGEFTYYGKQRIERKSSILFRELVTTGTIKDVQRTTNNPHGVMITNWKTVKNKDIKYVQKKSL